MNANQRRLLAALLRFAAAVDSAPPGACMTVGLVWDQRNGWRVVQTVGTKALAMGSAEARGIVLTYRKIGTTTTAANAAAYAELRGMIDTLASLADECEAKNLSGEIPAPVLADAPAAGSA